MNPTRWRPRLLAALLAGLALSGMTSALSSTTAVAVSLGGLIAGSALRILLDRALMKKATPTGRH
jgi:membrane associated rhomboid family serine protease